MFTRFYFALVLSLILVPAATCAGGSKPYLSLGGIPFDSSRDAVRGQMLANGYKLDASEAGEDIYSGSIDESFAIVDQCFNPAGKLVGTIVTIVTEHAGVSNDVYRHFAAVLNKRYGNPVWTKGNKGHIVTYWSPYDGKLDVKVSDLRYGIEGEVHTNTPGDGIKLEVDSILVKATFYSPEWNAEVARRIAEAARRKEAGKSKI